MNRTKGRLTPRKSRHFTIDAPNTKEMVQLSEMIQGIKQYQDDEYQAMQAEFDRVERLLDAKVSSVSKQNNMQSTSSKKLLRQEITTADQTIQPSVNLPNIQNHYRVEKYGARLYSRYTRWILLFFIILFFGVLLKMVIKPICTVVDFLLN